MFATYSLNRMLVAYTSVGFLFLAVDSTIEHMPVLAQEPWAFVPVIFGLIGSVFGFLTLARWHEVWIRRFQWLLVATFLIAGAGMYFHIAEEADSEEASVQEHERNEKDKPLLAPLSFAAIGAIGLLGTSRKWPAEGMPFESVEHTGA
jgi:hypothetical protein